MNPEPSAAPTAGPYPARAPRLYWEDFPAGHVMTFGGTPVARDAVIAFAQQFDPQPFHVDEEAARASLFGGLCASGWLTCAMAMRMCSVSPGNTGLSQRSASMPGEPRLAESSR